MLILPIDYLRVIHIEQMPLLKVPLALLDFHMPALPVVVRVMFGNSLTAVGLSGNNQAPHTLISLILLL